MDFFDDDYFDDFIDEIKRFFNMNSDPFDNFLIDYFNSQDEEDERDKKKSFEISYFYETGMDKPDIRVEGDFNKDIMKEFFGQFASPFEEHRKVLDAKNISLEPDFAHNSIFFTEPTSEVTEKEDGLEILLEVPGVIFGELSVEMDEIGSTLLFNAQNENRNYFKEIPLPYNCSLDNLKMEHKNGIVIILLLKK
jgi:HSP20 family molecular chaperone IbpA